MTALATLLLVGATAPYSDGAPDFNKDIRPILSDACFRCHGPDEETREAGLRLDVHAGAFGDRGGYAALVPGDLEASELWARVATEHADERMPPVDSGKELDAEQLALLRAWIEAGAPWDEHWAFVAPSRPELPALSTDAWVRTPIDAFVLERLRAEGLSPSPEADRRTLVRRLWLDLAGLPPSAEEVEAFVQDSQPGAWERAVERVLATDAHAEHMTRHWLDYARYGDTHGLHLDNYREMWPYRDWVVRAVRDNLPWDQFVRMNLAGDLLPEAGLEGDIASGFNRLHVSTAEGGSIVEEVLVRNVVDRVSTVGTVFLGLTMGCAVCHDHKFDPITAEDFYSSYAFFNNLDGNAMDGNAAAHPPVVRVPSEEQELRLDELGGRAAALQTAIEAPMPEVDAAQAAWEAEWRERAARLWAPLEGLSASSSGGTEYEQLDDGSVRAGGPNPDKEIVTLVGTTQATGIVAVHLEALADPSLVNGSNGRASNGNAVLSEIAVEVVPLGQPEAQPRSVRLVSAQADHSQANYPIEAAIDGKIDAASGWATEGFGRFESRSAVFAADEPFGFEGGTEIRVRLHFESQFAKHSFGRMRVTTTTDGAFLQPTYGTWHSLGRIAENDGQRGYRTDYGPEANLDLGASYGEPAQTFVAQPSYEDGKVQLLQGGGGVWYVAREIWSPDAREVEVSLGSDDAIKLWVNDELFFEKNVARGVAADQDRASFRLRAGLNRLLIKVVDFGGGCGFYFRVLSSTGTQPDPALAQLLAKGAEGRSADEQNRVREFYRSRHAPEWMALVDELESVQAESSAVQASFPTTLVMRERAQPREAYVLLRGQYDQPDTERGPLARATPAFLPPMPEGAPSNRLGYAEWLIDASHPLMARVTVNRYWQQCFGRGLVETSEDFGSQGAWPTHPELLDWLAVEFREGGWDVRELLRTLVLSSTYRQSSSADPSLYEVDPKNELLARAARYRLDAEVLRDQALYVSGLLVDRVGGPPVKPPQPSGLWKAVAYVGSNTDTFVADTAHEDVHRRSLYTFWKRTAPAPQMSMLDAPSREVCSVRRERTNTPMQALLLLNDPQYVEAARYLAQRAMNEGGNTVGGRAAHMFRLATQRAPEPAEQAVLIDVYLDRLEHYQSQPAEVDQLLGVGAMGPPEHLVRVELAAWTLVANAVLNLDEVLNRE